jgi:phage replication-related protein YjqB (UPF0714/DUF867 family)
MEDYYPSLDALFETEKQGADYLITVVPGTLRGTAILAPHGGGIEPGTSRLAREIAQDTFGLYLFEGLKGRGNRRLHITSHKFDEPSCLDLLSTAHTVLAVHGCSGEKMIYVGGLDKPLKARLAQALAEAGFPVQTENHGFPAQSRSNICNRGARKMGAQLEITLDLRQGDGASEIARVVRKVLESR